MTHFLAPIPADRKSVEGEERGYAAFDRALGLGLEDEAAGHVIDAQEVFDRLETKYAASALR